MTYPEIRTLIKSLSEDDQSFMFKASIVSAVTSNMDLGAYDDEGFSEICSRFAKAVLSTDDGWPDFDEVAYRAQQLIEDGEYETTTIECFEEAIANCDQ